LKKVLSALCKKVKKSKGGFTLIELIAVIAILAILALILVPTVGSRVAAAKRAAALSDARAAYMAAQIYVSDKLNNGEDVEDTDGTVPTDMLSSDAFKTLNGVNGFTVKSITIKDGAVISITIHDNNGDATYPESTASSSSTSGT